MRGSPVVGQDPHRVTVERAYAAAGRVSALRETMEVVARLQAETEAEGSGSSWAPLAALSTWLVDVVQCELVDAAVLLEELDAFNVPTPPAATARHTRSRARASASDEPEV